MATTERSIPPLFVRLQAFNGGYVDTAGFLALHGLFTAHVTGNFVTLGASLVHGTSGAIAKLLALPTFCLVVILCRLAETHIPSNGKNPVPRFVFVKVLLLTLAAIVLITYGPFANGDAGPAILGGLLLVAAMAIQNATHRMHLGAAPPSTLMTGTTTQVMLDVAELLSVSDVGRRQSAKARIAKMGPALLAFACGCLSGAGSYAWIGMWAFVVPPLIAAMTLQLIVSNPTNTATV